MPVRAKRNRHRIDHAAALSELFAHGIDWDGLARSIGVATCEYGFPLDLCAVKVLWRQHGRVFLDQYDDLTLTPWAIEQFGEPDARKT